MSNELLPLESVNALELFSSDKSLKSLLSEIEAVAKDFESDVSTNTGRKLIASQAYNVSRAKKVIDDAGKAQTDEWYRLKKVVDGRRKHSREHLDRVRDEIRAPLVVWEGEEAKAAEAAALKAKMEADHIEALHINDFIDREMAIEAREAEIAEREEAARLEAVAKENERLQKELEAKAKKVAEAKANKDAQDRIDRAEQAQKDAEKATKQAEADKEQERVDSARREEKAAQEATREAEEKARREEEEERQRIESAKQVKIEAAGRKKAHRTKVNKAVCKALIDHGIDKATAEQLVKLVSNYQISNLTIDYIVS